MLDALYSLGFHYPARAPYFSRVCSASNWPEQPGAGHCELPRDLCGRHGHGAVMPTSYLHFARDFDGDGHIDLFIIHADAIGSVVLLCRTWWQWGEPVAHLAQVADAGKVAALLDGKLEINQSWQQLQAAGVSLSTTLPPATPVKLLKLDQALGAEYWVLRHNFYVITRYNRNPLYAWPFTNSARR